MLKDTDADSNTKECLSELLKEQKFRNGTYNIKHRHRVDWVKYKSVPYNRSWKREHTSNKVQDSVEHGYIDIKIDTTSSNVYYI